MSAALDLRSARGLMALQRLPRVGRATALRAALSGSAPSYSSGSGSDADLLQAYEWAQRELERYDRAGIRAVTFFDSHYPPRLSKIADPPVVLFVLGNTDLLSNERAIAIVGTRTPSREGVAATRSITAAAAQRNWSIVSGLARGIDTTAHRAALDSRAPTVAILGAGLDRIYPPENEELAREIVAAGGLLVSELPFGAPPIPRNLIGRDRLQSGIALGVVLAQTGAKGGAMHTARFAAEQGRPIFCPVLSNADDKNEGVHILLNEPAESLCAVLPAWRDATALCRRLGRRPLAHPVTPDMVSDLLDRLESSLGRPSSAEQQTLLVPDQIG